MNKEIILVMGIQASGKSTLVKQYVDQGFYRLNRDEIGGSLNDLNIKIEELISKNVERFVLDNTYGTKESRKAVIDIAKKNGYSVRCVWLKTSIEDAQFNAVNRIMSQMPPATKGHPLVSSVTFSDIIGPNGYKNFSWGGYVPSIALYAYKKSFEKPSLLEGFSSIEEVEFTRQPYPSKYTSKAIILDYDGTLRITKSGNKYPLKKNDIVILPNREKILAQYAKEWTLLGVSNQSGIEKGDLSLQTAIECFEETNKKIGVNIDYCFCPHHSFPIRCFCRKPLVGFGVYLINKYLLLPSKCIFVGDSTSDKNFAKRCGFQYQTPQQFFENK